MSHSPSIKQIEPDVVRRVFARDYSLWPEPAPGDGGDWLGWLDLPETLAGGIGLPPADHLPTATDIDSVVVLGMGGSSLTSAVLAAIYSPQQDSSSLRRLAVLDTVNPRTIRVFIDTTDIAKCHFVVASKSGSTIEPLALEGIFRSELRSLGIDPTTRFTAISDPGTSLATRARRGQFRHHIATPENVGGRFSALSAFGMYPAGLCGLPTADMVRSAIDMGAKCQSAGNRNPAYALAEFMVNNAADGRDKLTVLTSESLATFGMWLEQLIAESTGKSSGGLIPVADEPSLDAGCYGSDRQFVAVSLASDPPNEVPIADVPCFDIQIQDPSGITGLFFQWELAVALASVGLGVYPFDQPNVESAKQFARQVLESDERPDVDSISLTDAVAASCSEGTPGRYVALCAFLPESDELTAAFSNLRSAISQTTGMATTFGYGPRYLHSTGQIHKGGSDSIIQIVIVQDDSECDIAVPDEEYTLAQLSRSQAVGDVLAMRQLDRRSVLAEVGQDATIDVREAAGWL